MPEMPPPPPRRRDGQPTIDSAIFDQDTPVRQQAAFDSARFDVSSPSATSNPFMDLPEAEESNPFLSGPKAVEVPPQAPRMALNAPPGSSRGVPPSQGQKRVIPPAAGLPIVSRPGAVSPDVKDAHAEFRSGGWKRPLVFVLVAGAVIAGMTLLPNTDKRAPTPMELSKAPPPAVIGRSLPPGRTSDEDVAAAEKKRLQADPQQDSEPGKRPSSIAKEGEFSSAFKAATN
jgi:hypothetical protein